MILRHLGASGLSLELGGARLAIDPPGPVRDPVVVTWSEAERVAGARAPLAAAPEVLAWLGLPGTPLVEDGALVPPALDFHGFHLRATRYPPIPYATPSEAWRKTAIALRRPRYALSRLRRTLGRPAGQPLVVEVVRDGVRVVVLGQALHRFLPDAALGRLVDRHGGADVAIAGTDYDDEAATGRLLAAFGARENVVADLIGPVRRAIGLPTRPIAAVLPTAPPGTRLLEEDEAVEVDSTRLARP